MNIHKRISFYIALLFGVVSLSMFVVVLTSISFILSCSKPSDKKAYEEIVATMSIEKAKRFFRNYPESKYRDRLANEIVGWCKQEETEECYKMILETLPKDHPRFKEVADYYEKHFGYKK